MRQLLCDAHTHTLFSRHAYSTIEENVRAAHEQGLELLGSADHFSAMLFEKQTIKNFQFFGNLSSWPREWHGVRLMRSCEADIVDLGGHLFGWNIPVATSTTGMKLAGSPTLQDTVFDNVDYVVASVHGKSFTKHASLVQTTKMYVRALENPKVLILGHPGRAGVPFDVREVVRAAKAQHKLIEINEHSLDEQNYERSHEFCRKIAVACAEEGTQIAVDSDAHISSAIGKFDHATAFLDEIDFPQELIATRSAGAFVAALHAAGLGESLS